MLEITQSDGADDLFDDAEFLQNMQGILNLLITNNRLVIVSGERGNTVAMLPKEMSFTKEKTFLLRLEPTAIPVTMEWPSLETLGINTH